MAYKIVYVWNKNICSISKKFCAAQTLWLSLIMTMRIIEYLGLLQTHNHCDSLHQVTKSNNN